jgi:hypothetical protein
MLGMMIKPYIGLGDGLQFSSAPENYFRTTGKKILDINRPWFFDHNPYVVRDDKIKPERTIEMWNFGPAHDKYQWPRLRPQNVYLSNAEIWAAVLNVPVVLNRPRLYKFEDFPFHEREMILLHIDGRSHGDMPEHVIDHVIRKYKPTKRLYQIGKSAREFGIPKITTQTFWDLAAVISKAQMLIGIDSGPAWIAACYPDVVVKKLRTKPDPEELEKWVPLHVDNIHSHWDDRCHQIFNPTEDDIGFTTSYRRI